MPYQIVSGVTPSAFAMVVLLLVIPVVSSLRPCLEIVGVSAVHLLCQLCRKRYRLLGQQPQRPPSDAVILENVKRPETEPRLDC